MLIVLVPIDDHFFEVAQRDSVFVASLFKPTNKIALHILVLDYFLFSFFVPKIANYNFLSVKLLATVLDFLLCG